MTPPVTPPDQAAAAWQPRLRRGLRLQWEAAQNSHVLLYPEGMVKLNRSAGEILARCDGRTGLDRLVQDLEAAFATTGLRRDVEQFLQIAVQQRWLEPDMPAAAR